MTFEQEPVTVKEQSMEQVGQTERRIYFFDGDRCTWNAERFMDIVYDRLAARGITRDLLATLKQEAEANSISFDTFDALRTHYEKTMVDQVVQEVEQEAASRRELPYDDERCLWMPGARELLASVAPENRVLLTRGGEEMQLAKLRGIVGIDTEKDLYKITDRQDKGNMIAEAFDPTTGKFVFDWIMNAPGAIEATHATLVEDRGKAFAGLETLGDKANGYWYQDPSEPQLPGQKLPEGMTLPPNVEIVPSLYAVRDAIRSLGTTALRV